MRKIDFERPWLLFAAALPWQALPGQYHRLEKRHLRGSLIVAGIETKTILVKSNEV